MESATYQIGNQSGGDQNQKGERAQKELEYSV
jgi:hypothetical protein